MSLRHLTRVIPVPDRPIETRRDAAVAAQTTLGVNLPTDIVALGSVYGTGTFANGYLTVFNPCGAEYVATIRREFDHVRDTTATEQDPPYRADDLFPCGRDDNGHRAYWYTTGHPDDWPVVLRVPGGNLYERWDIPLTDLLALALANRVKSKIWTGFTKRQRTFTPATASGG